MPHRNSELFKGPSFEEMLEQALQKHHERVVGNGGRTYFREPTKHDIRYHADPSRNGQRVHFPDGVPVEPSLGLPEPEDIADRVRRQIHGKQLAALARELGADTPEEAMDFDVEPHQDLCPFSGHEYSEQDEANDAVAYANMMKEKEARDKQAALDEKRKEYQELKAHFDKSAETPPPPPPVKDGA